MTIDLNGLEHSNNGLQLGLISSHMVRYGPLRSIVVIRHTRSNHLTSSPVYTSTQGFLQEL